MQKYISGDMIQEAFEIADKLHLSLISNSFDLLKTYKQNGFISRSNFVDAMGEVFEYFVGELYVKNNILIVDCPSSVILHAFDLETGEEFTAFNFSLLPRCNTQIEKSSWQLQIKKYFEERI